MLHTNLVLCFLILLFLGGCSTKVHYLDNKDVEITDIHQHKEGDFLVITALLVNDDDDEINNTVYRIHWLDEDDKIIETTSWRPVIVKGSYKIPIKEQSTVPGAQRFIINISNNAR